MIGADFDDPAAFADIYISDLVANHIDVKSYGSLDILDDYDDLCVTQCMQCLSSSRL